MAGIIAGDPQAEVLRLFESELDLVDTVARRIDRAIGTFAHHDELVAAGREGLFDAAKRFDASRKVPFKSYANIRIQGAIIDSVRKSARLPRRAHERLKTLEAATNSTAGAVDYVFPSTSTFFDTCDLEDLFLEQVASMTTAMTIAISLPSTTGSSDFDGELPSDPEDATARGEVIHLVRDALSVLSPDELAIVKLTYFEGMNLREAAQELQVNKSWAYRLLSKALNRLTKHLPLERADVCL